MREIYTLWLTNELFRCLLTRYHHALQVSEPALSCGHCQSVVRSTRCSGVSCDNRLSISCSRWRDVHQQGVEFCKYSITLGLDDRPNFERLNVFQGLVGFGLIPANFTESTGDTLGGFGSAIALKRGTFRQRNGVFYGTLLGRPDRGFNVYEPLIRNFFIKVLLTEFTLYRDGTIDYQARQHEIDFILTPYYASENLTFQAAQQTLKVTYRNTILQFDRLHKKTSGLDPTAVRDAQLGSNIIPFLDPAMPIVSKADNRLVLDIEGLVANADGTCVLLLKFFC